MKSKTVVFLFVLCFINCLFPTAFGGSVCKRGNGNFPKPGSFCRSYYQCKMWQHKEIVCPEDQHFYPAKGFCVWPEEYPCAEKRNSKECPTPNRKFLKPGTGCKVYYDCCSGKPLEKKCPGDTLFDHVRSKCEWPELYTCNEEPKSKKCPKLNGKFLKPGTSCKIYYECYNGQPTEKKCPGDQLFDHTKGSCEWPDLVNCEDEPKSKKCPKLNGKFLKPGTSCKIYYECYNGQPTEKKCPGDQLFDHTKGSCEWSDLVNCEDDTSEEDSGSNERRRSTTTKVDSSEESDSISSEEIQSTPGKFSKTPWPFTSSTFSKTISIEITPNTPSTIKDTITTNSVSETVSTTSSILPGKITTSNSPSPFTDEEISETESSSTMPSTAHSSSPTETNEEISETESSSTTLSTVHSSSTTVITTSSSYSPFTIEEKIKTDSISETSSTASSNSPAEITTSSSYPPFTNEEELRTDSTSTTLSTISNSLPEETSTNFFPTDVEDVKTDNLDSTSSSTSSNNVLLELTTGSSSVTEEENIKTGKSSLSLSTSSVRDDSINPTTVNIFCPEPNGYFPHPTDKHKFVGCVGGDPRILTCPSNLVYDHKKRSCVYSKNK